MSLLEMRSTAAMDRASRQMAALAAEAVADAERRYLDGALADVADRTAGMVNFATLSREQRAALAAHEAGHALLLLKVRPGAPFSGVSLMPRASEGCWGLVRVPGAKAVRGTAEATREVWISLGGGEAERLICGAARMDSHDLEHIAAVLRAVAPASDTAQRAAFVEQQRRGVKALVEMHRAEIEAVADALLDRGELTYRDVCRVVDDLSAVRVSTRRCVRGGF